MNNLKPCFYFAYASNMDEKQLEGRNFIFSTKQKASLSGYRLEFNKLVDRNYKIGRANIMQDENNIVEGILYETTEQEIIKLDEPEGISAPIPHYFKRTLSVITADGKSIEAVVYIANPERCKDGLKPEREYLNHLLAAKEFLSPEYYAKLKNTPAVE
jgi:gamma-glutamylcyclotransferase